MNNYILLTSFLFLLIMSSLEAQEIDSLPKPNIETEEFFKIVTYMPHFKGCEDIEDKLERKNCSDGKLIQYISDNLIYPKEARTKGIEGMAVVRFFIMRDGSLQFKDDAILRNPGSGCGEEALRVLKGMPNWIPGKLKGEAVNVQFTMPIKFQLTDDKTDGKIVPKFQNVIVDLNGTQLKGQYETLDLSRYVKTQCTKEEATALLLKKSMGFPVTLKFEKKPAGYTQYYIAVEKDGKKQLIYSDSKNKGLKKKILKSIQSGTTIYFYNWQFKMKFLEVTIK